MATIFLQSFQGSTSILHQIENDPKLLHKTDSDGRSVLHWAVSGKHSALVEALLNQGAEQDLNDEEGWTPLMIAVNVGSAEIVHLLSKAAVNITNNSFVSAMHYCASKNRIEIAKELILRGASVALKDHLGQTPIFRSASLGYKTFCELLIFHGAKLNVRDNFANTPLHLAIEGGHGETALFLIENNASYDVTNRDGKLPLDMTENVDVRNYLKLNLQRAE